MLNLNEWYVIPALVVVIGLPLFSIVYMAIEEYRKNKAKTVTPKKTEVKE